MSSTAAVRPPGRRRAAIWITLGVVVALVILFFVFAGLYADILWYQQLGYLNVLTTQWFAGTAMFFIGFFAMAIPLWLSIQLTYRLRPVYAKLNTQLDRYQQVVEPLRRLAMYGIPIVFGIFAGVSAASRWQAAAMWLNGTSYGKSDPLFHLDIGFYLFALPFYRSAVGFASAVVLIALLATLATCYLYGSVRVSGREVRISRAARVQISVIAGLYLLLQGISIWLDRYAAVTDSNVNDMINGAAYTDVNATIPARAVLAGIAVLVAIMFFATAFIGRWRFPLVGTALLIVAALVVGAIYPWVVQRFQVDPSQKTLETPYIQRSINATRDAYGLSNIDVIPYQATTNTQPGALRQDAQTTAQIRIMDPAVISPSFQQLQQFRQYYAFPRNLNVDRYRINGNEQDAVVAVRELNQSGLTSRSWFNDTVVYTHGYGMVAAYGNQRSSDGQPVFMESGIPSTGTLGQYEPRVYFGQQSPTYSIVGAPKGSKPVELDYPGGPDNAQQTATTFAGNGGPKLDNVFKRLVYALKFQDEQIVLSDAVNSDSQILYDRDPIKRVQKVAPYLTLDSQAYPAVIDGRIKWVIDGYTTSDQYPYSHVGSLSDAIADTETPKPAYAFDDINYIRNSVKATVDAYDGSVQLYAWDAKDPVLKTWEKVFPTTVKPISDMSAQLLSHVRYPSDLFKVQRAVLGQYHVTDAGSFYSRDDAWTTPNDPTSSPSDPTLQPPYYLTLQMPGQTSPSFSLYSTFIPQAASDSSRSILKGYLAVDADAGSTKGTVSSGYGKLRLLSLPSSDTIPGPGQVQNTFNSDPTVSQELNLLRQGKTDVINGNLLTLPVGGGLLYVQPVYVKSTGETSYPILQKVLVAFGDKIAFEDTLDKALDSLFGGDSGATAGDNNIPATGGGGTSGGSGGSGTGSGTGTVNNTALQQALQAAKAALAARETALKNGDWAAYGAADAQLQQALQAAIAAEGAGSSTGSKSGSTATPTPAPSSTPKK
ncbi:UPF0182 family protein [Leifsonia shinshuensis]|uniref:UPF0182 protein HNR13_002872 n=1 Tax=Leifsonia shinshuensis TaxID=150026 RepID=A0A853D1H8_9MICO|nr:hypothetical protein [Leifsonia shinshuensis]